MDVVNGDGGAVRSFVETSGAAEGPASKIRQASSSVNDANDMNRKSACPLALFRCSVMRPHAFSYIDKIHVDERS